MTTILKRSLPVAACAAALLVGTAVSASTISFTGYNTYDRNSVTFGDSDLNVTVYAGTFDGHGINYHTRRVDIDPNGLGADGTHDFDGVDGRYGNDVLVFSFNQEVQIDSINFTEVDSNDDFAFGSVSGRSFSRSLSYADVDRHTDLTALLSAGSRTGLTFGIGAIGSNDNFRVSSITVSAVPLPASGLLLLAAMGAGVGVSRRRKAAAKA
jgi:hypothetical protein